MIKVNKKDREDFDYDGLSREEKVILLGRLIKDLSLEIGLQRVEEITLPISIFNAKLGSFETIVKYLKENLELSNKTISELLNRSNKTIWATYDKAKKKHKDKLEVKDLKINIPISLFKDRKLSILETIVKYLKEKYSLSYHEIALYLKRDGRTIWTVYQRAKKKM